MMDVDYAASRYDQLNIDGYAGYILARTTAYCRAYTGCGLASMTGSDCDSVHVSVRCWVQCAVDSDDLWGTRVVRRMEVCCLDQRVRIDTV
jgi:hypothetical protein